MYKKKETQIKKPIINNSIKAKEVRLIDEVGQQFGVVSLEEAISKAKEKGFDLIQVTEKVDPPICKIMDYGKYIYSLKKKEKSIKYNKGGELKHIRLTFNISDYDTEIRAKQAEKFLKIGDKVMIEMVLRGREKAHSDFAKEKMIKFTEILNKLIPVRTEREIKRQPRGFTMIITKQ